MILPPRVVAQPKASQALLERIKSLTDTPVREYHQQLHDPVFVAQEIHQQLKGHYQTFPHPDTGQSFTIAVVPRRFADEHADIESALRHLYQSDSMRAIEAALGIPVVPQTALQSQPEYVRHRLNELAEENLPEITANGKTHRVLILRNSGYSELPQAQRDELKKHPRGPVGLLQELSKADRVVIARKGWHEGLPPEILESVRFAVINKGYRKARQEAQPATPRRHFRY